MRNRLKPKEVNEVLSALEATAPKNYSTTETATGQKWIDGKEIYQIAFNGTTGAETGSETIKTIGTNLNIISMELIYYDAYYT